MGGFDDHVAIIGDWMPPSPSPRAFFSSMIGDEVMAKSGTESHDENRNRSLFLGPGRQIESRNVDQKDVTQSNVVDDETIKSNVPSEQKMSSSGGLLERMAARSGFNAPRLNTESIRQSDLSQNPDVRSPYLTIPPGLSPTSLLESPVFLANNSLVQPSPTTGKFSFLPNMGNSMLMTGNPEKGKENTFEDVIASSFAFHPIPESSSSFSFCAASKVNPSSLSQYSENSLLPRSVEPSKVHSQNGTLFQQVNLSNSSAKNAHDMSPEPTSFGPIGAMEHSPPFDEPQDDDADRRSNDDPNVGSGLAEDGYNWRKYGQKQVKGSEYPRSYYKCTDPNCPVKKKVERSHEGHITEIIYKGAHNHPKPPPNRRSALGSLNALGDIQHDTTEQPGTGANGDPIWSNVQKGTPDWKWDNPDSTSAALGQEYGNGTTSFQAQIGTQFESSDGVQASSAFSNDEEEDDRVTHGSVSLGYEGEGDETESKRRKIETYPSDMSGATRAIREPRVVVQTTSEVDILDDGYRWRKYGQKVVKGNPNPRSYYKCTSTGCAVRKHVERASHDLKSVITTYEGKHNHDVPAARNSSHVNSGVSNTLPTQASTAAQSQIHRPEPARLHNSLGRFERPSLGSFGLPGRPQLGSNPNFGFGMNHPGLANLAMAGYGPNQGRLPGYPIHPYSGHSRPMSNAGFMLPKGEPKVEPELDSGLNVSNGSSVYHQIMNRLPLGPPM
ncbi:probable WRKY transcription factor 2 isoform X1 [Olea europaea var. sylvestris]|uniref:probable WRKY transcription factor 2 isoform X1 n=1 Tax=Olea europaea var. sylvestris TaxID=158386 RepID=UPI000C1D0FCF|nr:probable WRKY transcription factor 2 isoform X1 [Olea europaea var. sylvestris]XP_022871427.1 probable WRKY transcription factor 2 isoform X1 [Olea europaea var. sylvestris]